MFGLEIPMWSRMAHLSSCLALFLDVSRVKPAPAAAKSEHTRYSTQQNPSSARMHAEYLKKTHSVTNFFK